MEGVLLEARAVGEEKMGEGGRVLEVQGGHEG